MTLRGKMLLLGLVSLVASLGIAVAALSGPQRSTASTDDSEAPMPYFRTIQVGVDTYTQVHGALPLPIRRTPAHPVASGQPWPAHADPHWAELGFHPDVVHYSYELVAEGDDAIAIRAYGDRDGDGVESLFERSCGIVAGIVQCTPGTFIEREAE